MRPLTVFSRRSPYQAAWTEATHLPRRGLEPVPRSTTDTPFSCYPGSRFPALPANRRLPDTKLDWGGRFGGPQTMGNRLFGCPGPKANLLIGDSCCFNRWCGRSLAALRHRGHKQDHCPHHNSDGYCCSTESPDPDSRTPAIRDDAACDKPHSEYGQCHYYHPIRYPVHVEPPFEIVLVLTTMLPCGLGLVIRRTADYAQAKRLTRGSAFLRIHFSTSGQCIKLYRMAPWVRFGLGICPSY